MAEVYDLIHVGTDGNLYTGETRGVLVATVSHNVNGPDAPSSKPAYGRRFVAAWNACAGIPTAALEAGAVADLLASLDPDALEAIADEITQGADTFTHSARAASLRAIARVQRAAVAAAEGRGPAGA